MKKILLTINFVSIYCFGIDDRIQSIRFDKSKVQRIYLAPGLGSVILFPCAIQEIFVGRTDDLKVQISPNDKKIVFLNLKLNSSLPTNAIAKCSVDRTIFVFDVIPSNTKHQDVVEISSYYGALLRSDSPTGIKTESNHTPRKVILKRATVLEKGASL